MAYVVFLCTGNAARSVMGGAIAAEAAPHVTAATAGTHVLEGQPISWRTREALASIGLNANSHRSRQLHVDHITDADLIVAFEADHVAWVRRNHPEAAGKTASLKYLVERLPTGDASLTDRIASLDLEAVPRDHHDDVTDPAGGDVDDYKACAAEVDHLVRELLPRL